jgi:hypothetical protein
MLCVLGSVVSLSTPAHAALPTGTLTSPTPGQAFAAGATMNLSVTATDTTGPTGPDDGVRVVEWWLYADGSKGAPTDFSTQFPNNGEDKFRLARTTVPASGTPEAGTWNGSWTVPTTGYFDATVDGDHTTPIPAGQTRRYQLPSGQYEVQGHMIDDEWLANPGAPGFTNKEAVTLSTGTGPTPTPTPPPAGNLVRNADLSDGTGDTFTCFQAGGWGGHTATVTAVTGRGGSGRAAALTISGHTSGDTKLLQSMDATCAPAVKPGTAYNLSAWYTSTRPASLTVFRHSAAGWTYWTDLKQVPVAAAFTAATATTPPVPEGTDRLVWGLSLNGDGTVVTDDYAMAGPPGPQPPAELVKNGSLTTGSPTPTCFQVAGWGTHGVTQGVSTDVPAGAGGRSYRIEISGYASGDRKLLTGESAACLLSVDPAKTYDLAVSYKSSAPASLTLFRHTAAGWQYWTETRSLPVTTSWTRVEAKLPAIPAGTDAVSWGVSLGANGILHTHGYSMHERPGDAPPVTDPAQVGRWTVTSTPMPLRAMHATLLRDGRVLLIAGSGNEQTQFDAGTFRSVVWNPNDNSFLDVPTPADMFCSGHVTLPDGRVLVASGTRAYPGNSTTGTFQGAKFSYLFDPATNQYSKTNDMADSHWYATFTKLENGDVWAAGGLNALGVGTVATEMFSFSGMRWLGLNEVPQTYTFWGTYPHMYLLGDGRLFYAGGHTFGNNRPGTGASLYNWRTREIADLPGLRDVNLRDQAGSVLLPPAQNQTVLIAGGGHADIGATATNSVDIINLNASQPSYVPGPDLPGPGKIYLNLVTLPDRTVLAANGSTTTRSGNVLTASLYSPAANTWTPVAADPVPRNYHSTALLMPDGKVATFGSNPADNSFDLRISLYEPPYLFKGPRPGVTAAPAEAAPGSSFSLGVSGDVASAALTSPMSATHQTDTNARLIDLPITGSGATRQATVPANRALVPPGPYMLTVLSSDGVPSVARWINVR